MEGGGKLQDEAILSAKQQGENIFLTGKMGTGKSWMTKPIIYELSRHLEKMIHVTAPTDITAINVNGTTINSWGGFGLGEYYADFDRMMDNTIMAKIQKSDTLLVDETSTVNGHVFNVLECMVSII
jgi:DNA replication protein DnaC